MMRLERGKEEDNGNAFMMADDNNSTVTLLLDESAQTTCRTASRVKCHQCLSYST